MERMDCYRLPKDLFSCETENNRNYRASNIKINAVNRLCLQTGLADEIHEAQRIMTKIF